MGWEEGRGLRCHGYGGGNECGLLLLSAGCGGKVVGRRVGLVEGGCVDSSGLVDLFAESLIRGRVVSKGGGLVLL